MDRSYCLELWIGTQMSGRPDTSSKRLNPHTAAGWVVPGVPKQESLFGSMSYRPARKLGSGSPALSPRAEGGVMEAENAMFKS